MYCSLYCVVACGHCHLVPRVLLFHPWHQVSDNIEGTATPYIKFLSWALSLCSMGTVALYVYFSCRYFVCCVLMTCFGYGYWCFIFHIVMVPPTSKLTLACSNMSVFLYFCRGTRTELAYDTRVNFHVEHVSYISCATRDPSLCAAQL